MTTPVIPKKSWRTTTAGILALIASLIPAAIAFIDGDPTTVVDTNEITAAIMGAIMAYMGLSARDKNVSSEEQRAADKA